MSRFERTPAFERDLKKLLKKFRTLTSDLETIEQVLAKNPTGIGNNFVIIYADEAVSVVKARLACRALSGERALRVIYAYHNQTLTFLYIELYHKGDKENEDRTRVTDAVAKLQQKS